MQPQSASESSISSRSSSSTLRRARFAVAGEPPERRPAGEDGARAERERLDDVGASPDAAVDVAPRSGRRRPRRPPGAARPWAQRRRAGGRRGSRRRSRRRRARRRAPRPRRSGSPSGRAGAARTSAARRGRPRSATGRSPRASRAASRPPSRRARPTLGTVISAGHPEAGAQVALAPAEPRRIDGEHDRAVAVLGGLLDQRARDAAVAEDVELEPARRSGRRGRHLLRSSPWPSSRGTSASRPPRPPAPLPALAVGVREPLERDRRDEERHRDRRAEHGRRGRHLARRRRARAGAGAAAPRPRRCRASTRSSPAPPA